MIWCIHWKILKYDENDPRNLDHQSDVDMARNLGTVSSRDVANNFR